MIRVMSDSLPAAGLPPIVFLGTGEFGRPALRALRAAGAPIVCVVSQPDRPAGRGRELRPTPLHALADELSIPHRQLADVNVLPPREVAQGAQLGVVIDFGQKLGAELLAAVPLGFINLHGSLLPKYRGAAPVQWAILNGDDTTGATVFQLNEKWDAGAVLGRVETPIDPEETADELHDRLADLGAEVLMRCIADIAHGVVQPQTQDIGAATRAPKLKKEQGAIHWGDPAARIVKQILGLWSWPAAFGELQLRSGKRERVQIKRARVVRDTAELSNSTETAETPGCSPPASTIQASPGGAAILPGGFCADLTVQTGAGRIELLEVKPEGGRVMPFSAFANGRRLGVGDRFSG